MSKIEYRNVENLRVYTLLCDLHISIWQMIKTWPKEERFELTSQVLRSSNSSPAQLAEKNSDRHVKNRIEGVNRSRGEAGESIHHLYIGMKKGYITNDVFAEFKERFGECIRMLNGLEKNLEVILSGSGNLYAKESEISYQANFPTGYPEEQTPESNQT
jgi:four helix bundle protein